MIRVVFVLPALLLTQCTGFRAWMFNYEASRSRSKPGKVLRSLNVRKGQAVADLGAGGGYFTYRFARLVGPAGRVYAVDISRGFLKIIRAEARKRKLANIETVLARPDDSRLPPKSVDLVFVRAVFHHIKRPAAYFKRIQAALKPGGRVAILDYKPGTMGRHTVRPGRIVQAMEKAGYRLTHRFRFLSIQSFLVFAVR
jgi:ubiquinone/menaquinone biosynthesis C-methylase UbiE